MFLEAVYSRCLQVERGSRYVDIFSSLKQGEMEYRIICNNSNSTHYTRSQRDAIKIAGYLLTRKLHYAKY